MLADVEEPLETSSYLGAFPVPAVLSRQNVPLFAASTLPVSFVAGCWFYSE